MSNRTRFRMAVIGILFLEIAIAVALYFLDDGSLDSAWEMLPESFDWFVFVESNFVISILSGMLILFLLITSLVGVLLFRDWGRWLYLGSTLLLFPIYLFSGPTIYYAWESALWDITCMAEGAILVSMFLPPISNEFNKLSPQDAASGASA